MEKFYATRHQIYWRFDANYMVFASNLIWYHKQRQTCKRTRRDQNTDTLTNSYLYYNEWITCKIYYTEVHNVFAFQKLLTCRKQITADQIQRLFPYCEIQRIMIEIVQITKIYTPHRDSNLGKGYLVLVSDTLLF